MSPAQRANIVGYVGGALGVLSFIWGFLKWFKAGGEGVGGFSVYGSGSAAVVGFSLMAGVLAVAYVVEKRETTTLAPTALALTSALLALGLLIGKGSIQGEHIKIGAGIGLILGLITSIVQTVVLGYGWLAASGRLAQRQQAAPAWQGYPGQPGYGQPPAPPAPPTQQYPPAQPPAQPGQYQPPQNPPGYGPPQQ